MSNNTVNFATLAFCTTFLHSITVSLCYPSRFSFFRFFKHFLALFSVHNMAVALFRAIGAIGRTQVIASILSSLTYLVVFVLGGFIVAKSKINCLILKSSNSSRKLIIFLIIEDSFLMSFT